MTASFLLICQVFNNCFHVSISMLVICLLNLLFLPNQVILIKSALEGPKLNIQADRLSVQVSVYRPASDAESTCPYTTWLTLNILLAPWSEIPPSSVETASIQRIALRGTACSSSSRMSKWQEMGHRLKSSWQQLGRLSQAVWTPSCPSHTVGLPLPNWKLHGCCPCYVEVELVAGRGWCLETLHII